MQLQTGPQFGGFMQTARKNWKPMAALGVALAALPGCKDESAPAAPAASAAPSNYRGATFMDDIPGPEPTRINLFTGPACDNLQIHLDHNPNTQADPDPNSLVGSIGGNGAVDINRRHPQLKEIRSERGRFTVMIDNLTIAAQQLFKTGGCTPYRYTVTRNDGKYIKDGILQGNQGAILEHRNNALD